METRTGEPAGTVRDTNETAFAVRAAAAADTDTGSAYQAFTAIENKGSASGKDFQDEGKHPDATLI